LYTRFFGGFNMDKTASFYLITDTHYLSKKNWVDGKSIKERLHNDHIALLHTPEILDSYIEYIIRDDKTDTVLFLGDNVDNGDLTSHGEFRLRLERLKDAGKRVIMTYATHDYIGAEDDECNFQKPRRFTENGSEPIDFMRRAVLKDFYGDYTRKNALSVDGESGSYTVELNDNLLLIMLIDNGNGRSFCGLFENSLKWLEEQISDANEKGQMTLVCVHHPVLSPSKFYETFAPTEMLGGHKEFAELLCRNRVRAVFTGHTHIQNIQKYTSVNGNWFYDISTSSLANAYGKMRKISVNCESAECIVESVQTDITEKTGLSREELYRLNSPGNLEVLLPMINRDYSAFVKESIGFLPTKPLEKYRFLIRPAAKKLSSLSLYSVVKLAGIKKKLTEEERNYAKKLPAKEVVFEICRHVFPGNAPYTPQTVEYKAVHGLFERVDRLNIKKIRKFLKGLSFCPYVDDFLYNNRTGDDDSITFYLK